MKYLIGNWKSNKTLVEAEDWIMKVKEGQLKRVVGLEVVICPSTIHLWLFRKEFSEVKLGTQDLSPFPDGTYTGAVSARMLSQLIDYVVLGHSERRKHFGETNQIVARKVEQALSEKITPIVAVDKNNWGKQLSQFSSSQLTEIMVMYEPPEAISKPVGPIGEGTAAPVDEVVGMISTIREEFSPKAVIYGGSVKSKNIADFLGIGEIDGVLPGSASLDASEWVKMVKLAIKAVS